MIQRIQSVFLLLVAILMVSSIFFTGWEKENTSKTEKWQLSPTAIEKYQWQNNSYMLIEKNTHPLTAIAAVAAAVLAIISIFQYKNRPLQIRLGFLISLLIASNVALLLFKSKELEQAFEQQVLGNYGMALYLPMVALLCNILSNRFIHRDERLVRSMDRIR